MVCSIYLTGLDSNDVSRLVVCVAVWWLLCYIYKPLFLDFCKGKNWLLNVVVKEINRGHLCISLIKIGEYY
jgi:hypothetical protein